MKIGVIGTHGVGKTDVCNFLGYYLHKKGNAEIIIEAVRTLVKKENLIVNENTTFESQKRILEYQIERELEVQEEIRKGNLKYGIYDRTVIDNYIYAENKFPEKSKEILYPIMDDWIKTNPYDLIYRVPLWNEGIVSDGFRSENKEFQISINIKLNFLLDKLNVSYERIPKEFFLQNDEQQAISFIRYFSNILKHN